MVGHTHHAKKLSDTQARLQVNLHNCRKVLISFWFSVLCYGTRSEYFLVLNHAMFFLNSATRSVETSPAKPLLTKFSQRGNDQSHENETSTRNNQKLEEKGLKKDSTHQGLSKSCVNTTILQASGAQCSKLGEVGSGVPRSFRPHAVSKQLPVVFFRGVFGVFRFAFAVRAPISHMCSSLLIKESGTSDKSCPCIFLFLSSVSDGYPDQG